MEVTISFEYISVTWWCVLSFAGLLKGLGLFCTLHAFSSLSFFFPPLEGDDVEQQYYYSSMYVVVVLY